MGRYLSVAGLAATRLRFDQYWTWLVHLRHDGCDRLLILAMIRRLLQPGLLAVTLLLINSIYQGRANEVVQADPILRTRRVTIIDRSCTVVWPYLSDFSGIGTWYKAFRSVRSFSGPIGQVGEVREIIRGSNGQLVREKLIYLDLESMELAYTHVLNPPVRDNVALISLTPLAQRQCQVSWSNTFRLKPGQTAGDMTGFFTKAYSNALNSLKVHVESQNPPSDTLR